MRVKSYSNFWAKEQGLPAFPFELDLDCNKTGRVINVKSLQGLKRKCFQHMLQELLLKNTLM